MKANPFEIQKIISLESMMKSFSLINKLTPSLTKIQYRNYLQEMIPHNYFQVVATRNEEIIAVSGYWIGTKIYCGKYLEIDNFIVNDEYRSAGLGAEMILWLTKEADFHECKLLMLDVYVENFKAHKFYYNQGFIARGYHFLKSLH